MDRAELERQLEEMHPACWGWALACAARDRELAEDALQSAYLRILSGKASFDGRSAFRTWVFGVIRRTAMEEMRRQSLRWRREGADIGEMDHPSAPGPDVGAAIERADETAAITAGLAAISPRQREVLELVFYHGMTIEEAATVMDISLGSARTHYDRGKKALGVALDPRQNRAS